MSILARNAIHYYLAYRPRDMVRDERQGHDDASKMGAAASLASSGLTNEEQRIRGDGRMAFALYLGRTRQERDALTAQLDKQRQKLDLDLGPRREAAREEFDAKLGQLAAQQGADSPEMRQLLSDRDDAASNYLAIATELGRPLRSSLPRLYLPFMAVLAIAELPINRPAFELLLSDYPVIAAGLALVFGATLIFFAHALGKNTRQFPVKSTLGTMLLHTAIILAIFIFSVLLIYLIAIMRQSYFDLLDRQASSSFHNLVLGTVIADITRTASRFAIHGTGWMALGLNSALYFVGFLASFFHYDPHPDYQTASERRDKTSKAVQVFEQRYVAEQGKLISARDARLKALDDESLKIEELVADLGKRISILNENLEEDKKAVANAIAQRIRSYRKGFVPTAKLNWELLPKIEENEICEWIATTETA